MSCGVVFPFTAVTAIVVTQKTGRTTKICLSDPSRHFAVLKNIKLYFVYRVHRQNCGNVGFFPSSCRQLQICAGKNETETLKPTVNASFASTRTPPPHPQHSPDWEQNRDWEDWEAVIMESHDIWLDRHDGWQH